MNNTLIFHAQFTASKAGKNDLTPTIEITSIKRSDGTQATVVNGSAMTQKTLPAKRGWYFYILTGADLQTYDYEATAITADGTVDLKEVPALWTRFSEAVLTDANGAISLPANPPAGFLVAASYGTAPGWYAAPDNATIALIYGVVDTEVAAIKAKTDQLVFTAANKVDATVAGYATGQDPYTLVNKAQMTEGYAADGVAPTHEQMQFMLWSALAEFVIAGTTITCRKLDGTTQSMVFTLDDATNPSSRTRSS